jgi:hypothetical protein
MCGRNVIQQGGFPLIDTVDFHPIWNSDDSFGGLSHGAIFSVSHGRVFTIGIIRLARARLLLAD